MIIFGNDHLKIFVEVIEDNDKYIDWLILFTDTTSFNNYYNQFLGVQYTVDMEIIKYVTNLTQNLTSNVGVLRVYFFNIEIFRYLAFLLDIYESYWLSKVL
jgi:hypothetical protein